MTTKKNVTRDSVTNLFKEFAGQGATLVIPRPYIKLCKGDHLAALLLSQILYWTDRTDDPDGWFYKSYKEWYEELDMTEYQVRRAINGDKRYADGFGGLKALGVETKLTRANDSKKKGAATLHYRVNLDVLTEAIHSQFSLPGDDGEQSPVLDLVQNDDPDLVQNDVVNKVQNGIPETTSETTSKKESAPEGAKQPEKKQRAIDPYFEAIADVWNTRAGGFVGGLKAMMMGNAKSKTSQWAKCAFDPPVTDPAEIRAFGGYMARRMRDKNISDKPTAAVTIQRWFYDFRAEQKRKTETPAGYIPVAQRTSAMDFVRRVNAS